MFFYERALLTESSPLNGGPSSLLYGGSIILYYTEGLVFTIRRVKSSCSLPVRRVYSCLLNGGTSSPLYGESSSLPYKGPSSLLCRGSSSLLYGPSSSLQYGGSSFLLYKGSSSLLCGGSSSLPVRRV
jgi:hypothetical protein